jgi:uncharacterized membrane protein affecting hemolysin expression
LKDWINKSSLSQQLALVAAGLCLLISVALISLGTTSSRHMLQAQQAEYGTALAHQIARRISTALESGDLLSVAASLQRFVETSSAEEVKIFDVEGKAVGQAGEPVGEELQQFRAPVRIEDDVAGQVVITVSSDSSSAAQMRFVLSLLGLAVLLSLTVYLATRQLVQRLANHLDSLSRSIALEDTAQGPANELARLARNIEALPMDLLRTRSSGDPRDENYQTTAVLYVHLSSLVDYVDTLDHHSLHRYTHRLHQVIYAAAGFYAGELHVSRQFGLVLYFNGDNKSGSAAFRAASCAWLIQASCRALEKHLSLSLVVACAIAISELGAGDDKDIYPGLYMQYTIDELQGLCALKPPRTLLSPSTAEDADVAGRGDLASSELQEYLILEGFQGPYDDLLERQLRLICKRLEDPLGA